MSKFKVWPSIAALAVGLVACEKHEQLEKNGEAKNLGEEPVSANAVVDQWIGQWNGPEGTFLVLSKNGGKYAVKLNSLDGPATFEGIAVGDHIEFQRDGKNESIRAGSGADTGMKWLLGEKNCLLIKKSEGFCR